MTFKNPICSAETDGAVYGGSLPEYVLRESARGTDQVAVETRAYEDGSIYIRGPINDELSQKFMQLLRIAASDKKNLWIYINSPGGSVQAGLAMLDGIRAYPHDLSICCIGLAASMGAVLLAGGRTGQRYILPHSKVMVHEPLIAGGLGGSATSIQRTAESIMETKNTLNGLLAEFTGRTVEEIDKNPAYDNFFNAEEAIEFGLCDKLATGYEGIVNG